MKDESLLRTRQCWSDMKQRCYNEKTNQFKNYGARGIRVCDRWVSSFDNFFSDMGRKPDGFSIERIDVDGDYEPRNCKWADRFEQAKNMRTNRKIEFGGRCMILSDWAKEVGRHETTLRARILMGYPIEMILSPNKLLFGNVSAIKAMKGES